MSARLELHGVSVQLGGKDVLRDFDLSVNEGELLVLAGPSGSGKSTLLRAVAGLAESSGSIRIGGREVSALPPGARDVAMVFQNYALFPHLTIRDNLAFGPRARGMTRWEIETRTAEAAAALGLETLLDRHPRELSGGERQRVALARALMRQAQVFLMDEPLSNLDAPLRLRARAEILKIHRKLGGATIYVTHDQIEALALADRLGILRDGRLQQLGPPMAVYAAPANLFVAQFLGHPTMNAFEVSAAAPDAVLWRETRLPLRAELHAALTATGRSLKLGVRPEHVHLSGSRWAPPRGNETVMRGRIERAEPMGDQQFVVLDAQGAMLVARVEPDFRARPGDALEFSFDPAGVLLFDAATEQRL
ncbi:MAG: ABC transporter ATP-binding protein [Pseudomonadota bacterium]